MVLIKGSKYRIYPSKDQIARLIQWEDALRWLWNIALEQRMLGLARPKDERKFCSAFGQQEELTALRKLLPWLRDVPRHACNLVLAKLDEAWQLCFILKMAGIPNFKKKSRDPVKIGETDKLQFSVEGTTLHFPKIGDIPIVMHRHLEGVLKNCTISRDVDQWFVSFTCEITVPDPEPNTKPPIALDRGVVKFIADSDGNFVDNPRFGQKAERKLQKAQRDYARKQKGSKNQLKAKMRVAKVHRKTRRQREHFLHTTSYRYAKNHSVIVLEDLKTANMTRSASGTIDNPGSKVSQKSGLNKAILDAGWGKFGVFLEHKVRRWGGVLVKVNPAYSSQTCSDCGCIDAKSRKTQALFECVHCGHTENADVNAAKILLGRRTGGLEVCGGHSDVGKPTKQKIRTVKCGRSKTPKVSLIHGLLSRSLSGFCSNVVFWCIRGDDNRMVH